MRLTGPYSSVYYLDTLVRNVLINILTHAALWSVHYSYQVRVVDSQLYKTLVQICVKLWVFVEQVKSTVEIFHRVKVKVHKYWIYSLYNTEIRRDRWDSSAGRVNYWLDLREEQIQKKGSYCISKWEISLWRLCTF